MFKIQGGDGKEYGPVGAEVIREWIAARRANAQTQVQAEGATGYVELGQLPEFREALAQAAASFPRPPSVLPTSAPGGPVGKPSSGMAVGSLICGIVSFVLLPFLAAIPAIILGHIALTRVRREPARYSGRGKATAGLVLGYVNIALIPFIAIVAGLTLPALAKAKGNAQRISCVNNLKQIALAARIYANENQETFPPNFLSMSNELATPKILVCPGDSSRARVLEWSQFSESDHVTYEYLSPGAKGTEANPQQTVFRCPIHNNVGLADGSVVQRSARGRP